MSNKVLDKIDTDTGTIFGVVDYISTKYVTMFVAHEDDPPEIRMILITYKAFYPHLRFSVFKSLYFPQFQIRPPIMLNKKVILDHSMDLTPDRPNRRVTKLTNTPTT